MTQSYRAFKMAASCKYKSTFYVDFILLQGGEFMYTKDSFNNCPVFKDIIKKHGVNNLLDPLTKTVMRGHIMTYIEALIKEGKPFSMILLDIDNFKQINDNYGHHIGDLVLEETAKNIVDKVGNTGIVGRYGGDEFIIIDFIHNDYDSMHEYLEGFYALDCTGPFKRIVSAEGLHLLITGTIGTVNFPNNGTEFDDLFNKVDKALYRGKMKGRNCFIIYVHEKHKDIDISKLIKEPIQISLNAIYDIFESRSDLNYLKHESFNYIKKVTKISDVFFVNDKYELEGKENVVVNNFDQYLDDLNVCVFNSITDVYHNNEQIHHLVDETGIYSMLVSKIVYKDEFYGYMIFAEYNVERIWQNEDIALAITVSRLLGYKINNNK